jgi:hypothetical protein
VGCGEIRALRGLQLVLEHPSKVICGGDTDGPSDSDETTLVILIHGIGAASHETWVRQSVDALGDWWQGAGRDVVAESVGCPDGCQLGAGHRHLWLRAEGRRHRVDLEGLFWGDCVTRPGRARCASLVLQAGLLIGLVDALAAWLTAFEGLADHKGELELARSLWQLVATFVRSAFVPLLTLVIVVVVLMRSRVRATIGDALAWSTDSRSRQRVLNELGDRLRAIDGARVVLIGHSQGGSIATELEPGLRSEGREVRVVTLGSGHALLTAMHGLLPRWSFVKSVISWIAVFSFCVLTVASLVAVTAPDLHALGTLAAAPLRLGGYLWFAAHLPRLQIGQLLREGGQAAAVKEVIKPTFHLPSIMIPAEIASTAVALLLATIGIEPARRLSAATRADTPGVDIVATHDPVAAAMLQLASERRRRRVSQCGSLLLDHTSYLQNDCVVLPLLADQIEHAAGLRRDDGDLRALASEEHHRSGLAAQMWTRPLLFASTAGVVAWLGSGRIASALWISAAGLCCLLASLAVSLSSRYWLTHARKSFDPAYWMGAGYERERWRRAHMRWAGAIALLSVPLIGGGVVAVTTSLASHALARHPWLTALTAVAFAVGLILLALAWRSMFGFPRGARTTGVLAIAAVLWLLQGAAGVTMAIVLLAVAYWSHRREHSDRRQLAAASAAQPPG